jgi:hypothetical protein
MAKDPGGTSRLSKWVRSAVAHFKTVFPGSQTPPAKDSPPLLEKKTSQTAAARSDGVNDTITRLYDEYKNDPAAIAALMQQFQQYLDTPEGAPNAEAQYQEAQFNEVALDALANSPYASAEIKAKAREEIRKQQEKRLRLGPKMPFKPPAPKPPGF